jgi:hypothetical protein
MIFNCRRICRDDRVENAESLSAKQLPELVLRYSVILSKVIEWGEWKATDENYWNNKEPKTIIYFEDTHTIIIVPYEEFDKAMKEFYEGQYLFKNN